MTWQALKRALVKTLDPAAFERIVSELSGALEIEVGPHLLRD